VEGWALGDIRPQAQRFDYAGAVSNASTDASSSDEVVIADT